MSHGVENSLKFILRSADFVEVKDADDVQIDLRYAGVNNFAGENFYGTFNRAFLHKLTVEKFTAARAHLRLHHPGFKFIIFDALRPRSVQRVLWDRVFGTEGQKYFANPDVGSLHSFGFAIDLSLLDASGRELDMGAGFDDFREIAQPQFEEKFLREGLLKPEHVSNRKILRSTMEAGGFIQLPNEWWHYDALPKTEVRGKYTIVE